MGSLYMFMFSPALVIFARGLRKKLPGLVGKVSASWRGLYNLVALGHSVHELGAPKPMDSWGG